MVFRIERICNFFYQISIWDPQYFTCFSTSNHLGRIIPRTLRDRVWQSSRWVPSTIQKHPSMKYRLLTLINLPIQSARILEYVNKWGILDTYSSDIGMVNPCLNYQRPHTVHEDNCNIVLSCHSENESITTMPCCKVIAEKQDDIH